MIQQEETIYKFCEDEMEQLVNFICEKAAKKAVDHYQKYTCLYNQSKAAEILGVTPQTVGRWVKNNKIKSFEGFIPGWEIARITSAKGE